MSPNGKRKGGFAGDIRLGCGSIPTPLLKKTLKIALSLNEEDAFIKQGVLVTCHESRSAFLRGKRLVFGVAQVPEFS
jgi:hypothetical protein